MSVAPLQFLLLVFAGWVNRHQREIIEYVQEENRVLREQLGSRRLRFTDAQRHRLAAKGKALGRRTLEQLAGLVTPDTILRWYRELIAKKYDGTARQGGGRTGTASSLQRLVVRVATESPSWGYTRIRGALRNLGHELGRNTIKRILAEHGLVPAPRRGKTMPWKTFLKAHFGVSAATDFFTVEVLTLRGLVRYVVLFVIDLETRRVQIAGAVREPHGTWIQQVARNLVDHVDGFLKGKRYLLHDRDPLFTDAFNAVLRAAGVKCLKLPARSPNLNAFAERFVLSIKSECLDKLVLLGERHLRLAISEFVEHYKYVSQCFTSVCGWNRKVELTRIRSCGSDLAVDALLELLSESWSVDVCAPKNPRSSAERVHCVDLAILCSSAEGLRRHAEACCRVGQGHPSFSLLPL